MEAQEKIDKIKELFAAFDNEEIPDDSMFIDLVRDVINGEEVVLPNTN